MSALETDLRALILRGLGQDYTSVVTTTGAAIQAGNHYQSVDLGDGRTRGFRDDRAEFLDQIDFEGKKVLDLGSNLGELSREARARGASLVDGFEYDPYFIEIGELVNALTGTTRVSFYERDIGDPAVYEERYDMVLAFAVMGQGASKTISRIAEITDVLVLETHRLEGNFEEYYMNPISRFFPYHRMLGESDWGVTFDRQEVRATMVFAKTEEALKGALLDAVPVLDEPADRGERGPADSVERRIDVGRTVLQEKFFNTFEFDSAEELLAAVEGMDVDVGALARSHDSRVEGYDGWVLWFLFLKGYLDYVRSGEVGPGNTYFDYLNEHDRALDPVVAQEVGANSAREYISRQFAGMDRMRAAPDSPQVLEDTPPIMAFAGEDAAGRLLVYETDRPDPVVATRVDGWHRLFAAKLFGVPELGLQVVEDAESRPVAGELEEFDFDGGRLRVSGWCIDAGNRLDLVEVRLGKAVVGNTTTSLREDVAYRFGHGPFTHTTGFELDRELGPEARRIVTRQDLVRFRIVALNDWVPVGELDAFYLPGMFELPWPAAPLAARLMGYAEPRRVAANSLRRLQSMLEPVKRYRRLETFETVLDWGSRAGCFEAFLGHFMPHAQVTGTDVDAEAIEWARQHGRPGEFVLVDPTPPIDLPSDSFDLVLGDSMLSQLTAAEQSLWLAELRRVMKSGGYALLSLTGELLRPFIGDGDVREELDTRGISSELLTRYPEGSTPKPRRATFQTKEYSIREYSRTFDVLRYAVGALNDEDLIVLRKP